MTENGGWRREWLVKHRKKAKLTQEQVSILSELSRTAYANIESGFRNPSVKTAKSIATALKFDWIIFFKEECPETGKSVKTTATA